MRKTAMLSRLLVIMLSVFFMDMMVAMSVQAGTSDLAGLESGTTYYIRNVSTGKYLDVE